MKWDKLGNCSNPSRVMRAWIKVMVLKTDTNDRDLSGDEGGGICRTWSLNVRTKQQRQSEYLPNLIYGQVDDGSTIPWAESGREKCLDNGFSLGLNKFSVGFIEGLMSNGRPTFLLDVRNQFWEIISGLVCSDGGSDPRRGGNSNLGNNAHVWGRMHHGFQKRTGKLDITKNDQGSDSHRHRLKYIHLEKRKLTTVLCNMETIQDFGQNNFTGVVKTMTELKRAWEGGRVALLFLLTWEALSWKGKRERNQNLKMNLNLSSFYFVFRANEGEFCVCVCGCPLFCFQYLAHVSIHRTLLKIKS